MIKTVFAFFVVGLSMIILMPIGLVLFVISLLGLRKSMARLICLVAQGWGRFVFWCTGCTLTVEGRENIPKKGGVCFVSNHESIFDIVLLLALIPRLVGFIAKKELMMIPFLNIWILLLGGLSIDRGNPRKAVATIRNGANHIRNGAGIMIFPEGHRSKGRGLLPFHAGSFKLATLSGAPIVPVAIRGSYEVFEKTYRVVPGPIRVVFGKPIPTEGLPPDERRTELSEQVRTIIAEALAR
ncbi:1-acyl-sn-glycerol-3-phosphate acyltransferase [Spirochaetia bacterium]|nr:1-acyl-sn-glycerol-3-phosphate acyltransferase [Spirochaetia bacterium]